MQALKYIFGLLLLAILLLFLVMHRSSHHITVANPNEFSLSIWTSKKEYRPNELVDIYCKIDNLAGKELPFDGSLICGEQGLVIVDGVSCNGDGELKLVWVNSKTGAILFSSDNGKIKNLEFAGSTKIRHGSFSHLPVEGTLVHGKYRAESYFPFIGTYTLTLTVLGKSAKANFTIEER